MNLTKLISAAILALAVAAPASAVTVMTDRNQPSYSGPLSAPTSNSANFRLNFQGSDLSPPAPNSRTPWEEFAGLANTGYYNSVEANGFAEYAFQDIQKSFSIMWGSPDDYNRLSFYNGQALVFAIDGDDSAITNTPGYEAQRKFVNVKVSDIMFDRVRLDSFGKDAFEYSNVGVPQVPVPAAAVLLVTALGGLGFMGRKKRA